MTPAHVRLAAGSIVCLTAVLSAPPGARAAGQQGGGTPVSVMDVGPTEEDPAEYERRTATRIDSLVRHALALPADEREPAARAADELSTRLVEARPGSADAHHWRAVTAGVLAEIAGTGEKIELGRFAHREAVAAIEIDDEHAGAHHVLGRIHAGVSRLGWFTRFFAARMGMGELIDAASWEDAEEHLGRAVELEPQEITFRLELAVLLIDRDREGEARPHLERILTLDVDDPLERAHVERARALLDGFGR